MNEIEIDIIEILKYIVRNIHKIFIFTVVFGISFFGLASLLSSPKYETSTMIMIARSTDINQNTTYANIAKSNVFISEVMKKLDLNMSNAEFSNKVKVEPDPASRIINIKVSDSIPERAADIANQTAVELKTSIEKFNKNQVLISDKAKVPENTASSNVKKYTALGIFFGFIVGIIYVLFNEYSDTRIKSIEEIQKYYKIPIIGVIPEKVEVK